MSEYITPHVVKWHNSKDTETKTQRKATKLFEQGFEIVIKKGFNKFNFVQNVIWGWWTNPNELLVSVSWFFWDEVS